MIHISKVSHLAEQKENGRDKPFDCKFVKASTGEVVVAENVICTSVHSKGRTMNLKWKNSNEFRKVKIISIIEFNGQEVFI